MPRRNLPTKPYLYVCATHTDMIDSLSRIFSLANGAMGNFYYSRRFLCAFSALCFLLFILASHQQSCMYVNAQFSLTRWQSCITWIADTVIGWFICFLWANYRRLMNYKKWEFSPLINIHLKNLSGVSYVFCFVLQITILDYMFGSHAQQIW